MALGNILKEARMRKELSASEVAATTRMKIQLVQAIEKEDYSAFPATIYGKGFIKLFAECVDVDPTPLIEEYITAISSDKATQPAPTPIRKPRKILIDTDSTPDDAANENKKTENQPELPIQDKVPPQKTTAENKPTTDDLFSRINTENKQQEKPFDHPEKESEPIKEIKLDEKVKPETKEQTVPTPTTQTPLYAPQLEIKEETITKSIPEKEENPPIKKPTPATDLAPIEKEDKTDAEPIPVINQEPLSTTPLRKETKTVPASAPIKKLAADASLSLKNLNVSETHIKTASISTGVLILLILLTTTITRCARNKKETAPPVENRTLQLAIPPADPYLE